MSLNYIENRIRDALKQADGNVYKARQQVIAWTYEDTKLLHELAKPHLTGIIAYHIERVLGADAAAQDEDAAQEKMSAAVGVKPKAATKAPPQTAKPAPKQPKKEDNFGMQILRNVAGDNTEVFGFDSGRPGRPKKASQAHIDALRALAKKPPKE